jgi:hypothetical protein
MRTNETATLKGTMACAAFVTVVLAGLPHFAAATDSEDCNPATCTSPVMGPGYHSDVETR